MVSPIVWKFSLSTTQIFFTISSAVAFSNSPLNIQFLFLLWLITVIPKAAFNLAAISSKLFRIKQDMADLYRGLGL